MHIHTSDQDEFSLGIGDITCNWGVHIAGLYNVQEERDEMIFGFLKQGDLAGDLQLYCPAERDRQDFVQKFSHYCPECSSHLKDADRFSLLSAEDLYYPEGVFSPWAMDIGLNSFFTESQKNGRRNIRATAEMVWALDAVPGTGHLMAYESRLNCFIPGKPWVSMCLYNTSKFSGSVIMNVLRTHPFVMSGGILTQNPYYINPDKWLADNAPEFLPEDIT